MRTSRVPSPPTCNKVAVPALTCNTVAVPALICDEQSTFFQLMGEDTGDFCVTYIPHYSSVTVNLLQGVKYSICKCVCNLRMFKRPSCFH